VFVCFGTVAYNRIGAPTDPALDPAPTRQNCFVSITVDPNANSAGLVTASGGTPDRPSISGHVTPGTYTAAQGRLVLAADGKTVEFQPVSQDELDAVIAADEA
jgi:hypothetical protein